MTMDKEALIYSRLLLHVGFPQLLLAGGAGKHDESVKTNTVTAAHRDEDFSCYCYEALLSQGRPT